MKKALRNSRHAAFYALCEFAGLRQGKPHKEQQGQGGILKPRKLKVSLRSRRDKFLSSEHNIKSQFLDIDSSETIAGVEMVSVQVPLRAGIKSICVIPVDITAEECERIKTILGSYVIPR